MGAAYGKKKAYSIDHQPPPKQHNTRSGKQPKSKASAFSDRNQNQNQNQNQNRPDGFVPPPDYGDEDQDLIRPRKLLNPVKTSKSHQDLHRELLSSKRGGVHCVEVKPELHRVLESRRRDQHIRQKKLEEEARRKISPLEAELKKRHQKLEEMEQQQQQQENLKAPEFIKVKENLRRTSFTSKEDKDV